MKMQEQIGKKNENAGWFDGFFKLEAELWGGALPRVFIFL